MTPTEADAPLPGARARVSGWGKHALLVLAGFFLLVAGGLQFLLRPQVAGVLQSYREAPVLEVKEVGALEGGSRLLLSAVVAESNAPLHADLVAYVVEEHSSGRQTGGWHVIDSATPGLLLRGLDGDTITAHGEYVLLGGLRTYAVGGSKRYRGLAAGDSVGVLGRVQRGTRGIRLLGEVVTPGDAESLVADQDYGLVMLGWFVGFATAAGLLCLVGHAWRRRGTSSI